MFQPHVILHPTDFSERSRYAFQVAVDLARQNRARLVLLHVAHPPGPEDVSYAEAASELQPEGYHRRLGLQMRQFLPPPADLKVEYVVREGAPADEIVEAARQHHGDLLVIGTHGKTGLSRVLLGSTAERIVRLAPCAVLTIKGAQQEP
jgi:nucleotide-binding universal stress UspA family protein